MAQCFNQTHTALFNSNIKKKILAFEEYMSGACLCKTHRLQATYEDSVMFTSVVIVN